MFRILLPCTGQSNAEVDVNIYFNLTLPINNNTTLTLKRKKICLKGLRPSNEYKISKSPGDVNTDIDGDDNAEDEEGSNPSKSMTAGGEASKIPTQHEPSNSVVSVIDVGGTRVSGLIETRVPGSKSVVVKESERGKKDGSNVSPATTFTAESSPTHSLYIVVGTVVLFSTALVLCFVQSCRKSRENEDTVNPNFE